MTQVTLESPSRALEFTGGRCACGRFSLIVSRCQKCMQEELDILREAPAESADAEYDEVLGDITDGHDGSFGPEPNGTFR